MNLLDVMLLGGGALLISAAVKNKSPRDIIAESVGGAKTAPKIEELPSDEGNRGRARDYATDPDTEISGMVTSN